MGKTRHLFKEIRDKKETFHVKMGSIKDRNVMDLTEAEDIKEISSQNNEFHLFLKHTQNLLQDRSQPGP